jgi:penicillin-binding protein 2
VISPLDNPREPLIPRMFYRRVLLLGGLIAVGLALPALQLARLTLVKGDQLRDQAESKLISRAWRNTSRGKIVDRNGLVLAIDRPAYDIAVEYPVITGQWAFSQASARARRENRARWNELTAAQRQGEIDKWLPQYRLQLEAGWDEFCRLAGVSREEVEERKAAIIADVSRQAATVWERQRAIREDELNRGRELSEQVEVTTAQVARPIREQTAAHVILRNVEDKVAFRFPLEKAGSRTAPSPLILPGVSVIESGGREYPFDEYEVAIDRSSFPGPLKADGPVTIRVEGVGVHLVGWMRDRVFKEDQDRRPLRAVQPDGTIKLDRGGYMAGDSVGHWGLERSAEDTLRGERGLRVEQLDTGEVEFAPPKPGQDVQLTLDAKLQARIQALLSEQAGLTVVQPWQKNKAALTGDHLSASAVVIEVASGEVLAMVSTPTFTRRQLREQPDSVFKDEKRLPLLNRAIARPYPPGSIVKPLIFCSAAAMGVWSPEQQVECTGHLLPDRPNLFRCWIYKPPFSTTHQAVFGRHLGASDALMVSCNIYFYTLGRVLGPERIGEAYRMWGVGRSATHPDLGLGDQFAGVAGPEVAAPASDRREMGDEAAGEADDEPVAPRPTPPARARPPQLALGESILMGMGQGPVAWTPLHAADAYATLARGGVRIVPRIRRGTPVVREDLKIPPRAVRLSLDGLKRAVSEERGTGHHITVDQAFGGTGVPEVIFNAPGVEVWGKSGTADSGLKARDSLGNVLREVDGRAVSIDHSWFVVLAGKKGENTPRYAIAVLIENGGSGGRVAGPVCNQVIWALIAEGYL